MGKGRELWSYYKCIVFISLASFLVFVIIIHTDSEHSHGIKRTEEKTIYPRFLFQELGFRDQDLGDLKSDDAKDTRLSALVLSRVKLLCFVVSRNNENGTKAVDAIKRTWGARCDKTLYFISNAADDVNVVSLNISDSRHTLTQKSVFAFKHLYQKYLRHYDWFLKADDDSFLIVENLKFLLLHYDATIPWYGGDHFRHYAPNGYMSGGAGYVFSREGLRLLVEEGFHVKDRCLLAYGSEDVEIGRCAYKAGVRTMSTLDKFNRSSFHSLGLQSYGYKDEVWPERYMVNPFRTGPECCSLFTVSFHYCTPADILQLEFLLYKFIVYGRDVSYQAVSKFFTSKAVPADPQLQRRAAPGETLRDYYNQNWKNTNETRRLKEKYEEYLLFKELENFRNNTP